MNEQQNRDAGSSSSSPPMVMDQPGKRLFFLGVLISIIVAFVVDSQLSPPKLKVAMKSALVHIHKDVKVDFESAQVFFRRGVLPSFRLVVSNVELISQNRCWLNPILAAPEIELPLDFFALIRNHSPFQELIVKNAVLKLRGKVSDCAAPATTKNGVQTEGSSESPLTQVPSETDVTTVTTDAIPDEAEVAKVDALAESAEEEDRSGNLKRIEIDSLEIYHQDFPGKKWTVESLNVRSVSFAPRVFFLTARTTLAQDLASSFLSTATLELKYSEAEKRPRVEAKFDGHWREGTFATRVNWMQGQEFVPIDIRLNQMPVVKLIPLLESPPQWIKKIDPRKVWISLDSHYEHNILDWKKSRGNFANVSVVGDLGVIKSSLIDIESLAPLRFKPSSVTFEAVQVIDILRELVPANFNSWIADGGSFTGELRLLPNNESKLNGELNNIHFIFANQGERSLQRASFEIGIEASSKQLLVRVPSIRLEEGRAHGELQYFQDFESEQQKFKFQFSELALSPRVYSLFFDAKPTTFFEGLFEIETSKNHWKAAKGFLQNSALGIEGIRMVSPVMFFSLLNENLAIRIKSGQVDVDPSSPVAEFFRSRLGEDAKYLMNLQGLKALVVADPKRGFQWKDLELQSKSKSTTVISSGSWDDSAEVSGQLHLKVNGKSKSFVIQGTRDNPEFVSSKKSGAKN